jgi:hypothetical protein
MDEWVLSQLPFFYKSILKTKERDMYYGLGKLHDATKEANWN